MSQKSHKVKSLNNAQPSQPRMWRSLPDSASETASNPASSNANGASKAPARSASAHAAKSGLIDASSLGKRAKETARRAKIDALLAHQPKVSRRGFLAGTAAVTALSMQGCARRPIENILPYVEGPEFQLPGQPIHFATVTQRGTDALGILVTSHEGRPTKIEGNRSHGRSRGATDMRAQLAVWDLYDPDRSQSPAQFDGEVFANKTFSEFDAAFTELLDSGRGGVGMHILMPPTNSPSMLRLRAKITESLPQAKFHQYTSVDEDNVRAGGELAFGHAVAPIYNLSAAKVILALDSDFLSTETGSVLNAGAFASRRRIEDPETEQMNRLYSVEATFSVTGASADHRLQLPSQDMEGFLRALAIKIGGISVPGLTELGSFDSLFLDTVASELSDAQGGALIMVGRRQPPQVHALAHAINDSLRAPGTLVAYQSVTDPTTINGLESLKGLVDAGNVRTLLILGGNPVYDSPGDIDVAGLLANDRITSIHLGSHRDETAKACTWHVPMAHELETWGDQRSSDSTMSIQQPLIQPLWGGRSPLELLARVAGEQNWRGHYVTRKTFRDAVGASSFDERWRAALHSGVVAGTMVRPGRVSIQGAAIAGALSSDVPAALGDGNYEVNFVADPRLFDGRYANNLWALEAPDPMTKLVWDNAAVMSKATADGLGVRDGDMVRLTKGDQNIEIPAFVLPGHAPHSITVQLGWGRTDAGRYGTAHTHDGLVVERDWTAGGFDVRPIRSSDAFYFTSGVTVEATHEEYWLVTTQQHDYMEGRPIAIDANFDEYRDQPDFASYQTVEMNISPLWEQVDYSAREVATDRILHKWGMVIDLSSCIGCGICSIACQAENNIPAVGKQEVGRGRTMTWLRIDRYFVGDDDADPRVSLQPIGCQHCEEAPCENVCPVNATIHSEEGLNDMAYNRCVGTRYCANNCPYKVRRFNYLDWHAHLDDDFTMYGDFPETRKMQFNPNVTVRMRGVMEKCSYCVHRIQEAKYEARREHRGLRDGDIVMACEAACPSGSIVFGDLNDDESRVTQRDAVNRRYKLLAELGVRPRTTFLGKIRNPNPELEAARGTSTDHDSDHESHQTAEAGE